MIISIFSDISFIIITILLIVFISIAFWQKLKDAVVGVGIVYIIFLIYLISNNNINQNQYEKIEIESITSEISINKEININKEIKNNVSSAERINEIDSLDIDNIIDEIVKRSSRSTTKKSWISNLKTSNANLLPLKLLKIEIGDNVAARNIEGKSNIFTLDNSRVYCLTGIENRNEQSTIIYHKWYMGDSLESNIMINVGKSYNWRSWSYINIAEDRIGQWKVVVEDFSKNRIDSLQFTIVNN